MSCFQLIYDDICNDFIAISINFRSCIKHSL
jgi:hypothetical protein